MTEQDKPAQEAASLKPWQIIDEQVRILDRSLNTIQGYSDESGQARSYIIGQIEALKWASKLWEV